MQTLQEEPKQPAKLPRKTQMAVLKATYQELWRLHKKSVSVEENEKIAATLHAAGALDVHVPILLAIINAVSRGLHDDEESHRLDRYLVGGCGIIDLYVLQMLASVGTADVAVHISWIVMALALPCAIGSLFYSFLRNNATQKYGKVHILLSGLAIYGAMISVTALIVHFYVPAGVIFLVISIIVSILGLLYAAYQRLMKYLVPAQPQSKAEEIYD